MAHKILFVCLGNICRSPLAEAAFRTAAAAAGLAVEVDSAGTGGWHAGEPPDPRAIAVARRHGVDIAAQRARQVAATDFARFDRIYALDRDNLAALRRMAPVGGADRIALLLDLVPGRAGGGRARSLLRAGCRLRDDLARRRGGGAGAGRATRRMSAVASRAAALVGGTVVAARLCSGGNLAEVTRVALADGRTIVAKPGATARAEAEMLAAIAATGAPAPRVLAVEDDLLVLAAVAEDGRLDATAWPRLAAAMARLHAPTSQSYGWPRDHAFGPVAIVNAREADWPRFWGAHRIAVHAPHVAPALGRRLEALAARLPELLPSRPAAALLHGDLWSGNVLVGRDGAVTLIDPACAYGDREVDVAMLTLFGSPPPSFFDALGLAPGWRERLPVYRLWPLLVHLRLFGASYLGRVEATLAALGA